MKLDWWSSPELSYHIRRDKYRPKLKPKKIKLN